MFLNLKCCFLIMLLYKKSSHLDYLSLCSLAFFLHFDTEVILKHKKLSCKARILSCSLMKKYKVNSGMFIRQQYCNLFLVQYLREISHENTLKKLTELHICRTCISKTGRLGGLQVWFSVVMELDSPRLKFRLDFMNDLAGEMQNSNLSWISRNAVCVVECYPVGMSDEKAQILSKLCPSLPQSFFMLFFYSLL